jgi:hypothetical protein
MNEKHESTLKRILSTVFSTRIKHQGDSLSIPLSKKSLKIAEVEPYFRNGLPFIDVTWQTVDGKLFLVGELKRENQL